MLLASAVPDQQSAILSRAFDATQAALRDGGAGYVETVEGAGFAAGTISDNRLSIAPLHRIESTSPVFTLSIRGSLCELPQ